MPDLLTTGSVLAAFLAGQYAESGWSRTAHYAWISGLLLELGITSLDDLPELAPYLPDMDDFEDELAAVSVGSAGAREVPETPEDQPGE